MLSYLSGVATSFAVNILSNLVYEGYIDRKDREIIEAIQERIVSFNRRYDNTVLDTNAFDKYLKNNSIDESILQVVFITFEVGHTPINDFKAQLSIEAIKYVNKIYSGQGRSEVRDEDIFFDYFDALIDEMMFIRSDVLSFKDKASASIIVSELREARDYTVDVIREEINVLKGDNIFAEDIIQTIIDLVNQWQFDSALAKISETLEDSEHLSVKQKEILLFQRARVYINRSDFKMVDEVKKKITRLNDNSKYIYEIDFYVARDRQDQKLYRDTIEKLKALKYSAEKLKLKQVEFMINNDMFSDIITEVLIEEDVLRAEFAEYAEAHFYNGLYLIRNKHYSEAKESFDKAYSLRNSAIYRYDSILSWYYVLVFDIEAKQQRTPAFIKSFQELVDDFNDIHYLVNEFDIKGKSEFWSVYITAMSMIDPNKALEFYNGLEQEIKNTRDLKNREAGLYFLAGNGEKALELLESMTERTLDGVFQMLLLYMYKEEWQKMIDLIKFSRLDEFEELEGGEKLDAIGSVEAFYLLAEYKMSSLEMVTKEIRALLSKTEFDALELDIMIGILKEHKQHELWEHLLTVIQENFNNFYTLERGTIANKLLDADEPQIVREILLPYLSDSEDLIKIYLSSFENLEEISYETRDAYKVVCELYKRGCRFKTLLRVKCSFEKQMDIIRKLFRSLEEYKKQFGIDDFYSVYYLEAKIRSRDTSDTTEVVEYIKESGKSDFLMLVAEMYTYLGQWSNAQEIALDVIYNASELLKEHLINFISFHMRNTDKEKDDITLEKVVDNSVVYLIKVDENGSVIEDRNTSNKRIIAIHRNSNRLNNSNVEKFECENRSAKDSVGLILISTGYKGENVTLKEGTYIIKEIKPLHTYVLQKCWGILEDKYPNHNFYQKVATDNMEDMVDGIKEIMSDHNQQRKKQLDMYNFIDNPIGMPVSFLGGKGATRYVQTLTGLLYNANQLVYGDEIKYYEDENYILSISSIILLMELGLLEKLVQLKDKLFITSATKNYVESGVELSNVETATQAATMFLTEDNNLSMVEYTDKNKKDWKVYWSKLLLAIMDLNVVDVEVVDNDLYDSSAIVVLDADIQSIETARVNNWVLVSDDLFIRNVARSISESIKSTNVVGFLMSSGLLTIEETFEITLKLSIYKYMYSVDESILLEIYYMVIEMDDDMHWEKFGKLLGNLMDKEVFQYYHQKINNFMMQVLLRGVQRQRLYDFVSEKLGMKPYEV